MRASTTCNIIFETFQLANRSLAMTEAQFKRNILVLNKIICLMLALVVFNINLKVLYVKLTSKKKISTSIMLREL